MLAAKWGLQKSCAQEQVSRDFSDHCWAFGTLSLVTTAEAWEHRDESSCREYSRREPWQGVEGRKEGRKCGRWDASRDLCCGGGFLKSSHLIQALLWPEFPETDPSEALTFPAWYWSVRNPQQLWCFAPEEGSATERYLIWARNEVWENRQWGVRQKLRASGSKITVFPCWGSLLLLLWDLNCWTHTGWGGVAASWILLGSQGKGVRFSNGAWSLRLVF